MLSRFSIEITTEEYQTLIKKTCGDKKNAGRYLKFTEDDKIHVVFVGRKLMYPITVYPIDCYNKNKAKTYRKFSNYRNIK